MHNKQTVTSYALIPAILTPLSFFFTNGYCIGTTNSAAIPLKNFYRSQSFTHQILFVLAFSYYRYGSSLTPIHLQTLWTITAAIFPIGGVFGAMFLRPLLAKVGKRKTLICSQVLCVAATLLMCTSYAMRSFEALIIGRCLLGVFAAIGSGVGPMYTFEISSSHIRGTIGSLFPVCTSLGATAANILGLPEILGTSTAWPYLLAVTAIPSIIYLGYSPWLPESPRSLYLDKKDPESAKKVLERLRGGDDVTDELKHLREEQEMSKTLKQLTVYQVLTLKRVRWQVISGMVIASSLQLNGMNGIMFYLDELLLNAGISHEIVGYVSISVTGSQVVIMLIGGFASDKFGRKRLLFIGNSMICLAIILYTIMTGLQSTVSWFSYISVVAALGFSAGFCFGSGPATYAIVPELFDQSSRPAAMSVASLSFWSSFVAVGVTAPYLFIYLKFAALLPFLAFTIGTIVYVYFVIPETKGKSVVCIQTYFAKWNKTAVTSVIDDVKGKDNASFAATKTDQNMTQF